MGQQRVLKGVPAGGQFAATNHTEPSVQLARLQEMNEAFSFEPGTRVRVDGHFGTVIPGGTRNKAMVRLDDGWTVHCRESDLVPWDAYLDTVMPPTTFTIDQYRDTIPQQDADRQLRASLTRMRNARDSSTSERYYAGVAAAEAEVVAALSDADADPETIQLRRGDVLSLEGENLSVEAIRARVAAPLTALRSRRLAGYFASRAVEMHKDLGAKPSEAWTDGDWTKQGAKYAFSSAAVRFANAAAPTDNRDYEERFSMLLLEGETNTDTIIGEVFETDVW